MLCIDGLTEEQIGFISERFGEIGADMQIGTGDVSGKGIWNSRGCRNLEPGSSYSKSSKKAWDRMAASKDDQTKKRQIERKVCTGCRHREDIFFVIGMLHSSSRICFLHSTVLVVESNALSNQMMGAWSSFPLSFREIMTASMLQVLACLS